MFYLLLSNFFIFFIFLLSKYLNLISFKKSSIGGVFFVIFIFLNLYNFSNPFDIKLFVLLGLIFLIGVLDDLYNLSVIIRFIIITILLIIYFFYFNKHDIGVSIFPHKINIFLVIILILGFVHTLNMIDGIDGLYLSQICLLCITCLIFTSEKIYLGILINLSLLLILNLNKYLIVGNSGNYFISSFFAFVAFSLNQKAELSFLENLIIFDEKLILSLFSISIIDGLRVSISRLFQKKSPFKGDFNHLHHYPKNKIIFLIIFIISQTSIFILYMTTLNIYLLIIQSIFVYVIIFMYYKNDKDKLLV